jgi:hypothetical protein
LQGCPDALGQIVVLIRLAGERDASAVVPAAKPW